MMTAHDPRTVDYTSAPFAVVPFREERQEVSYLVIDTRVTDAVKDYDGFQVVRPKALRSSHLDFGAAADAADRANADFLGVTVEDIRAEEERRLIERLTGGK